MLLETLAVYGAWSLCRDVWLGIKALKRRDGGQPASLPATYGPNGTPIYRGAGGRFTRQPPDHADLNYMPGGKMSITDFEITMRGRTTEFGG